MHTLILVMALAANPSTFNFREYAEAPWGDIVLIKGISHFCYGEVPQDNVRTKAKCVNLERIKAHRCSIPPYRPVTVSCNKDI